MHRPHCPGSELAQYRCSTDSAGGKRWFTFDGDIEGSVADVTIIETTGGVFLQPDMGMVSNHGWGSARFSVVDCNNMALEIDTAELVTSVALTRLTESCTRP